VTKKKKILLAFLLATIIFVTFRMMFLTTMEKSTDFLPGKAVREIIAPLQKGFTLLIETTNNFLAYFSDNETLRQQNKELSKKIVSLEDQLYTLKEHEMENQRLLALLRYQEQKAENYELEMAKVIGRNPANWYEMIIVDKGSKQGMEQGMIVVNHEGLIGRVIGVTANTAEVLLILDREGAVGARIFENRLTPGVVEGTDNSQLLKMIHLPHDVPIEPEQTVVTSGLGGIYPKGIRIGKVVEVVFEPNGLMKMAMIKPFVDFSRLEEVFIIKYVKKPEELILPEDNTLSTPGGES
jgi:rod shape-determining protein MreC